MRLELGIGIEKNEYNFHDNDHTIFIVKGYYC